jgi:xanthine dehydrogenase accessory factor
VYNPRSVFDFIRQEQLANRRLALATITAVTGASARSCGTHMAIAEDGRFAGSLTGGCIEAAVVAEAQTAISEAAPRTVLYGANSPFIDIRLPCGGSVELSIAPVTNVQLGEEACSLFERRKSFRLTLSGSDQTVTVHDSGSYPALAPGFVR